MRKSLIAAAVVSVLSLPALAEVYPVPDSWQITERIELKNGMFLNLYRDGKMAMENTFGQSVHMPAGQAMQARDGRSITMNGNETIRVEIQNPLSTPTSG